MNISSRRKIVITGSEGQIVRSIVERGYGSPELEFVALRRSKLDLTATTQIAETIIALKPDAIISAAAYTAVDQAESDAGAAFVINAEAPREIAKAAAQLRVPIIHLSTDYVFDGTKCGAYLETDLASPLGVYGTSKLLGERAVAETTDNHVVLRTAWVYSPFGRNFLITMLRLAQQHQEISVVDDQFGNPTSAFDIADGLISVLRNLFASNATKFRGTFHMAGTGVASWADFATQIFSAAEGLGAPAAKVKRISTKEYPTPAKRPANSQLSCERLANIHRVRLAQWQNSALAVVKRVIESQPLQETNHGSLPI